MDDVVGRTTSKNIAQGEFIQEQDLKLSEVYAIQSIPGGSRIDRQAIGIRILQPINKDNAIQTLSNVVGHTAKNNIVKGRTLLDTDVE